jgi:hypothetical protein
LSLVNNSVDATRINGYGPNIIGSQALSEDNVVEIVGFDLGDAETAFSKVLANKVSSHPTPIFSTLAKNNSGIIKTVVGYSTTGETLVGLAAANAQSLHHNGLKVGFKSVPVAGDGEYAKIVRDFVDTVIARFEEERLFDTATSKFVVGYPSKWKNLDGGRPVSVLEGILRQTLLARSADLALVPESRGAMVEAIYSGLFGEDGKNTLTTSMAAGWALVVDIGSSTTDFTAVNLSARRAEPIDVGEELGARLIDRAIVEHALATAADREQIEAFFGLHPEERAKFELACRDYKEEYFSGQEIVRDFGFTHNGRRIYLSVTLDHATMTRLTSEQPIATVLGRRMSWRGGFRHLLEQVKADLAAHNVSPISAILLTGGASKMGFVRDECRAVFPDLGRGIIQAGQPQFTVANGLARWGRIEVQTQLFTKAVEKYCDETIPQHANSMVSGLFEALSNLIADNIIGIIKSEFAAWKKSEYPTINAMKKGIENSIQIWLKNSLPGEIAKLSGPALERMANELIADIKDLETRFAVPIGTLGGRLSISSISDHGLNSNIDLSTMDMTGGASDVLGTAIGIIAGLVTGLVMLYVVPIVLGIVLNIIALISTTLATIILGVLTTNPVGWAILAGLGVSAIFMGGQARELAMNQIPNIELPSWVRALVPTDTVDRNIAAKRDEIFGQVAAKLESDQNLRANIIAESVKFFRERLVAAADDARMLIS